ncbi:hypothetical protein DFJ58DRAFT_847051 [Suillus subalutaceus]|uniref:uncharacterized protein n=1 Tax=Suillus subalutaceus TaxID=48586 RepID=UPI001B87A83F|nr:uncharacterized protein DFJ58DRAFT_847051 [Suillus subalutaceus]KAG1836286.1 hypothetical protein DFJ58DRAFT_847051 [Suillus subalutaceus]
MSTPLPTGNETATQASKSALRRVKNIGNPSHTDHLDPSDFPGGGVTAWGTALGAPFSLIAIQIFQLLWRLPCELGPFCHCGSDLEWYSWIGVGLVSGRLLDWGASSKPNGYYQASLVSV